MEHANFRIYIEPRGQGRARATVRGKHASMYKDKKDQAFETTLAALAAEHRPREGGKPKLLLGPLSVTVLAVMPRPADHNKVSARTGACLKNPGRMHHAKKPDIDNIAKALLDAMKDWWGDDCQVVELHAQKVMAAYGEPPHYTVVVSDSTQLWLTELPF